MTGAIPQIHWKGEVNLGHVLVALTMAGSIFLAYGRVASEIEVAQSYRAKYVPVIEANDKLNEVQGERIDRMADAFESLRDSTTQTMNLLRSSNETLAAEQRETYAKLMEQMNGISLLVARMEGAASGQKAGVGARSQTP